MAVLKTVARKNNRRSGQAAIEFALLYTAVIVPLTFGIVYVAEMYWVWHSAVEFTREGARYATTHCWQADGQNVMTYMQSHVPVNIDVSQFRTGGSALINVNYYQRELLTLHGRAEIKAADPRATRIIGNFRQRYPLFAPGPISESPIRRWLGGGHARMEADPRLWAEIEKLIREAITQQR